ncbi:MAG: hypothetical protein PHP59_03255 [Methanofollis sp.]|uniref:hypothetical protein n=1 Tax=Methanofollis sp. TaxID=2052835 RepID=UPI00262D21FF|nr:hypothetical protein [Methanofollis sp.]MDD4254373.1 hypothetical protein [Methanofollis sp.]
MTSNIGNYIVNGDVTVLAVQKSASYYDEQAEMDRLSHVDTDYVKPVVERKV